MLPVSSIYLSGRAVCLKLRFSGSNKQSGASFANPTLYSIYSQRSFLCIFSHKSPGDNMTDTQNTNPIESATPPEGGSARNWKRDTILFLSSQTISLFGSMLVQYAITWYITLTTRSGVMLTISILCGFLPTFIISPFAGVWADRYNRKNIIVLADSFIAVSTLVLAVLFLTGYDEIWLLFVVLAMRALGTGIHTPAVGAILPQIVPTDKLPGLMPSTRALCRRLA
jgi:Na+/melibiose symporter-like transporter